jgi:DNA-binding HxlR family transcriptional regulator
VVGERWTLLIIRELLAAPRRYGELLEQLPGIGTNLLVARLRDLERAGVVRRALAPSPQSAVLYQLTDRGHALRPAVDALENWGAAGLNSNREPRHSTRV